MLAIAGNPEQYLRYLEMQGDNPLYSVGNIALAMVQSPTATRFGTKERWKTLGRSVMEGETQKGFQIFARSSFGKGYVLTDAYDISQTQGRDIKQPYLENDSREMESALTTLLNYSVVPVSVDSEMDGPAFYDENQMELYINPGYSDQEAFSAIAAEVAHSRFHAKGTNAYYDRGESELDAQSVSYILCRRFGVKRDMPDVSSLETLYSGWTAQEVRSALDSVQNMCKQIGGSIEKGITPQQHTRGNIRQSAR